MNLPTDVYFPDHLWDTESTWKQGIFLVFQAGGKCHTEMAWNLALKHEEGDFYIR